MTQPAQDNKPDEAAPEDLFEIARRAAANKQPDVMIEALAGSGFLDGLVRRLEVKWDALPRSEIEECVAQAVDSAYAAIAARRKVANLGGWLWKAADNTANDSWRNDYAHRTSNEAGLGHLVGEEHLSDTERVDQDQQAEFRRGEAIRLARSLLPRIGQGQIINVMELVIDAVEQGVPDLSPADIGEAIGITPDAARTLLNRGFSRLRREARCEGIELPEDLDDNDAEPQDA